MDDILDYLKECEPEQIDKALQKYLICRPSDEIYYLLSYVSNKNIEQLIYRLAEDRHEYLTKLIPSTLEDKMKLEYYINTLSKLSITELENLK